MESEYQSLNYSAELPAASTTAFQLTARFSTDIWRKPPATEEYTAPILFKELPLSSLKRARIIISAPWSDLFDQGGIILAVGPDKNVPTKWVKSGIEFYKGRPMVSTVVKDNWADWSLVAARGEKTTIELEREVEDGVPGTTLCVYHVEGDVRTPIREVTWIFHDMEDKMCWVGAYAAKPQPNKDVPDKSLTVNFEGFEIETV